MIYKIIVKGRLEFGTSKSFDKVMKMYQHRVENYYKADIFIDEEEIFEPELFCLNIPRLITQNTVKSWKNTVNLLEYIAQFAVAGHLNMWMTDSGRVLHEASIEPESDKGAVRAFIKGRALIQEEGKETEAISTLSHAIQKYERHAHAYERRGYVNLKLENYKDAMYDFSKSIDVNPNIAEPHAGRAKIHMMDEEWEKAILDWTHVIKKTIPLQPLYWQARRTKANCHFYLRQFDKAAVELKFFTNRKFTADNPNYKWRKDAFFKYGQALLEVGDLKDSLKAFNTAIDLGAEEKEQPEADQLLYRGIARHRVGESGFAKDWKQAAKLGSKQASELLQAHA